MKHGSLALGEGDGPHLSVKHVGAMTEPKNELEWHVALTILSTFSTAHVQFVLGAGGGCSRQTRAASTERDAPP